MKRNGMILVLFVLVVLSIGLTVWCYSRIPKIAYVRSSVLVEEYYGMKEARNRFNQKVMEWNSNMDTLLLLYNNAVKYLDDNKGKLSQSELKKAQEDIISRELNYKNYSNSIETLAEEENEKITQGALNQINSFIEKYAKEHHIDIIIGVTLSGNVLYGADKIDITNEILEGLNDSYK